jgi:hypothetical protein
MAFAGVPAPRRALRPEPAMDRLLVLELSAGGCAVEAALNGMPVAALGPAGGSTSLAVHEYTLAGRNQLSLVIAPPPPGAAAPSQPRVAIGPTWARARLVLVRLGQSPADPGARVLGVVEWATAEGKSYEAPSTHSRDVDLPVSFPRWRWLDAPPIPMGPEVRRSILEFLQQIAVELGRGNPDPLIAAAKLRFDELALAYQTDANAGIQRFRDHVQRLYAAKALKIVPPVTDELVLRPLVDGRLIDCLAATGGPALRTQNDAPELGDQAWPTRLAMVEGRIYVLR